MKNAMDTAVQAKLQELLRTWPYPSDRNKLEVHQQLAHLEGIDLLAAFQMCWLCARGSRETAGLNAGLSLAVGQKMSRTAIQLANDLGDPDINPTVEIRRWALFPDLSEAEDRFTKSGAETR